MKQFLKFFIVTLFLFTIIFTPTFAVFDINKAIGDLRIFGTGENDTILAKDLPTLVDENSPFFETFTNSNRVNILLLGINTNLTDTILLASYDMTNQDVDLISIPRDTYYDRENSHSAAERKINAAYHDGGALGTAKAVSDLLMGIPINYYMELDYDGVGKIVNALGGIPVNIPFRMYYTDPYDNPPLVIDFQPGEQILQADDAIKFLRFRKGNKGYKGYPNGDIGRIEAQQEFMKSAFKQAMSLRLPSVIAAVLENVKSDLTLDMALKIATSAKNLDMSTIETYTLPGEARNGDGGLSFYFYDEAQTKEMLTQIYTISPEPTEGDSGGEGEADLAA